MQYEPHPGTVQGARDLRADALAAPVIKATLSFSCSRVSCTCTPFTNPVHSTFKIPAKVCSRPNDHEPAAVTRPHTPETTLPPRRRRHWR